MSANNNSRKNYINKPIRLKSRQFFEVSKPDFLITLDTEKLFKSISKKQNNTHNTIKCNIHLKQKSINNTEDIDSSNYPDKKNINSYDIKDNYNIDSNRNNKSLIHVKVKHQFSSRGNKKQKLFFINNSKKFENSLNISNNNISINNSKLDNSVLNNNKFLQPEKNKFKKILPKTPICVLKKLNLNPIEKKSLNKLGKQVNQSFNLKKRNYSYLKNKNEIFSLTYDLKDKKVQRNRLKKNSFSFYNNKNKRNSYLNSSFKIEINKKEKLNNLGYSKNNISPLLKQITKSIRSTSNSTSENSKIVYNQKIQNKNHNIISDNMKTPKSTIIDKKFQIIIKNKKLNSSKTIQLEKAKIKLLNNCKKNKSEINNSLINNINSNIENENYEEKIYSPIRIIQSTKTNSAPKKGIIYTNNINNHIKKIEKELLYKKKKKLTQLNSICQKGYSVSNIKNINQDNFFIKDNFFSNSKSKILGVCDGHGTYGHEVSLFITTILPEKLTSNFKLFFPKNSLNDISFQNKKTILVKTYKEINNLLKESKIDTQFSGSTCITLIITNESILTSNLGDSRAILCKSENNINFTYIPLSKDHKPNLQEEKNRIEKNKGRVSPFQDSNGNLIGPMRVWCQNNDFPGLAMSRSLGDEIAHSVGVIDQCDVTEFFLQDDDKFFVVASDGLWEFISEDEVTLFVKDFYLKNDSKGAVQKLFEESRRRWLLEHNFCDDITIVIGFFN